jgi:alpha-L-fucosidase 2
MQWKDAKLVKLVVKSNLGGNLRLRTPNELKNANGSALRIAVGKNNSLFYSLDETAKPVISEKASIKVPTCRETKLYDISTQKGQIITLLL